MEVWKVARLMINLWARIAGVRFFLMAYPLGVFYEPSLKLLPRRNKFPAMFTNGPIYQYAYRHVNPSSFF